MRRCVSPPGVPHRGLPPAGDLPGLLEGHRGAQRCSGLPGPHPAAGEWQGLRALNLGQWGTLSLVTRRGNGASPAGGGSLSGVRDRGREGGAGTGRQGAGKHAGPALRPWGRLQALRPGPPRAAPGGPGAALRRRRPVGFPAHARRGAAVILTPWFSVRREESWRFRSELGRTLECRPAPGPVCSRRPRSSSYPDGH